MSTRMLKLAAVVPSPTVRQRPVSAPVPESVVPPPVQELVPCALGSYTIKLPVLRGCAAQQGRCGGEEEEGFFCG